MKLVTDYWAKPIPPRQFDWVAHYDDEEGPSAYGRTEQEAINALLSDHPPCKDRGPWVAQDGSCLRCGAWQGEKCR